MTLDIPFSVRSLLFLFLLLFFAVAFFWHHTRAQRQITHEYKSYAIEKSMQHQVSHSIDFIVAKCACV